MDTGKLEKFAQKARRQLREQVAARLEQVLSEDSIEQREKVDAIQKLRDQIEDSSRQQVIDKVAYTWFNRFVALRFMDVNYYTRVRTVSPVEGHTQPEILQEAKQGVIDPSLRVNEDRVLGLLNGEITSPNPQQEAYRLLLVGACNGRHEEMPFLFQEIDDYTELLLPEDLLSENAVLQGVRETLTPEMCQDVEVIGWVYQFYISEKKDEVIGSKGKIQPEDIPAATQLFTPHWIVRYLVENSLGRLWLLNNPESSLREVMDYYIEPVEEEEDYLEVESPEELKICDPACGSGHMLTYAFDLLYHIYEEEGYDPVQIPGLILKNNLYGIEIDDRAGDLAGFALMMKAREKDQRFFSRGVEPNICVLENVEFTDVELEQYMDAVGRDLFTGELEHTLKQFEQAENVGALIKTNLSNPQYVEGEISKRKVFQELFLHNTHKKVIRALEYISYLQNKYHVLVTNPPYISYRRMNDQLKSYQKTYYDNFKKDLFSSFIKVCSDLNINKGFFGVMCPNVWMYISSHEELRKYIIGNNTIISLVELPLTGFTGATVQICSFVLCNYKMNNYEGSYFQLVDFKGGGNKMASYILQAKNNNECEWFYTTKDTAFKDIPGSPIAYWINEDTFDVFLLDGNLEEFAKPRQGMATSDVNRFLRLWFEVSQDNYKLDCSNANEAKYSGKKWFPTNKGGGYRKWYGNNSFFVNWYNNGQEVKEYAASLYKNPTRTIKNMDFYFLPSVSWGLISSKSFSARYSSKGFLFDVGGPSAFPPKEIIFQLCGLLNSIVFDWLIKIINPTLNYNSGDIAKVPVTENILYYQADEDIVQNLISIHKGDWDSYERSWGFERIHILQGNNIHGKIKNTYKKLRNSWIDDLYRVKKLEEKNNYIFIQAYNLEDEVDADVNVNDITLTSNPLYRYGGEKSEEELEHLLLEDTIKEFISYSVGCMFGRYSLDEPGLILASQGDAIDTYLAQIPDPSFMPDNDNVIPVLEEGWFPDDITERFKHFLRVTFGEEHYQENLDFLEEAIGRDIRDFFLKDFYDYHCKMYSKPYYGKRPIYWMFESPKGHFKALIYMHRYTPDMVSIVLNDYLHEFRAKLQAQEAHLEEVKKTASKSEQIKADKEFEHIKEILADLREYEDDILYPLATERIQIDLDDGVDNNYPKFGKALAER